MDALEVTEQHHEDGEADGRFGSRDDEYEKHEQLPRQIGKEVRKRNEVHIDRQQHQFEGHQQNNQVLAIEEYSDDADREQDRAQNQKV